MEKFSAEKYTFFPLFLSVAAVVWSSGSVCNGIKAAVCWKMFSRKDKKKKKEVVFKWIKIAPQIKSDVVASVKLRLRWLEETVSCWFLKQLLVQVLERWSGQRGEELSEPPAGRHAPLLYKIKPHIFLYTPLISVSCFWFVTPDPWL